jgi:hypothetical protein
MIGGIYMSNLITQHAMVQTIWLKEISQTTELASM